MKKQFVFLACLVLASCIPANTYCPEQEATYAHNRLGEIYQQYADKMESYKFLWDLGYDIETEQIQEINKIKMLAVNLKTPECLDKARFYMIDSITSVEGALYLAQIGDSQGAIEQLIEGSRLISLGDQELAKLRNCMPNCTK